MAQRVFNREVDPAINLCARIEAVRGGDRRKKPWFDYVEARGVDLSYMRGYRFYDINLSKELAEWIERERVLESRSVFLYILLELLRQIMARPQNSGKSPIDWLLEHTQEATCND